MPESVPPPAAAAIADAVARALDEDRAREDRTTRALLGDAPEPVLASARIVAREDAVLCGLPVAEAVFRALGDVEFLPRAGEGARIGPGEVVADLAGDAYAILAGERTALNFLGRLSGVATETRRFVEAVPAGSDLAVLDTRKTTPGLRALEKYAVRVGGGTNHRTDLAACVFLKDNHIALAGGIEPAVRAVRARDPGARIVLEVDRIEDVPEAVALGVDRILLDNLDDEAVAEALRLAGEACEVEVSGGVTAERIPRLAALGVRFVSVGALTRAARMRDFSLEVLGLGGGTR